LGVVNVNRLPQMKPLPAGLKIAVWQ